jgi:plastocyanin
MQMMLRMNLRGTLLGGALVLAAATAFGLAGCSGDAGAGDAADETSTAAQSAAAMMHAAEHEQDDHDHVAMSSDGVANGGAANAGAVNAVVGEDGIARVDIEAGGRGFAPDTVRVVAGQPTDLVFTRTSASRCVADVHIPDLGIGRTDLVLSEPVAIRIQPEEPGRYQFRCGMDMLKGTIIVTPAR